MRGIAGWSRCEGDRAYVRTFRLHLLKTSSTQLPASCNSRLSCHVPSAFGVLGLIKWQQTGPLPQADALVGEVGVPLLQALCSSRKLHALSLVGPSLALVSKVWPGGQISTTWEMVRNRFSAPSPDLKHESLGWDPAACVSLPGGSAVCSHLEPLR